MNPQGEGEGEGGQRVVMNPKGARGGYELREASGG